MMVHAICVSIYQFSSALWHLELFLRAQQRSIKVEKVQFVLEVFAYIEGRISSIKDDLARRDAVFNCI